MLLTIIPPVCFPPEIKRSILSLFIEGINLCLVSKENLKTDLSDNPKTNYSSTRNTSPEGFTYCQDEWCI